MPAHILALLLLAAAGVQAQEPGPPSAAKLSLHLIARYTPGARKVVAARPPVLKVLDLHADMLEALREYKRACPAGRSILRIYTQKHYPVDASPEDAARDYWQDALWPPLEALSPDDRRLVDYLEGPNECEAYPAWESPQTAAWFARFWVALEDLMAAEGFRPCVGSIPVGNPPGDPREMAAKLEAFAPALVRARELGGVWSYHAYSLSYGTDAGEENWFCLRYRMLRDLLPGSHPELADLPLVLTEGGIDLGGNPRNDGWQARGDAARYEDWLAWFDDRLREDPCVLGVTLFQCGDTAGWPSFDTEPVNEWIATRLREAGPRPEPEQAAPHGD
jgi:hypothetical protein